MFRGVRGAITVKQNDENEIVEAAKELFLEIIKENELQAEQIASVFISVTDDLTSAFPARALRQIEGFMYVPVMCMKEITVENALEKCIRVMMHVNTEKSQQEIKHIYLENAIVLRPDLTLEKNNS